MKNNEGKPRYVLFMEVELDGAETIEHARKLGAQVIECATEKGHHVLEARASLANERQPIETFTWGTEGDPYRNLTAERGAERFVDRLTTA